MPERKKHYWTRIQEGDYSPDDLALMLLRAYDGSHGEAKKALTRASNNPRAKNPDTSSLAFTSDDAIYLAAYAIQKKERCTDNTALKKLLGPGKYRVRWNRLRDSGKTLKQIARRYPTSVKAKP